MKEAELKQLTLASAVSLISRKEISPVELVQATLERIEGLNERMRVFITVMSGTMTFYESDDPDCQPIVRTAGQGFLDTGKHAHIARNESGAPATNVVTYFAPKGATLRIDEPDPGNCPF